MTICNVETMHQGHAVKPVVESEEKEMKPNEQRKQPDTIEQILLSLYKHFVLLLAFTKLKSSRSIS